MQSSTGSDAWCKLAVRYAFAGEKSQEHLTSAAQLAGDQISALFQQLEIPDGYRAPFALAQ